MLNLIINEKSRLIKQLQWQKIILSLSMTLQSEQENIFTYDLKLALAKAR
jgi:hypothetical protein